jgi:hypothetical protein
MEFVVSDWPADHEDREVYARVANPDPIQIRAAIFSSSPIDYGTHFILSGSSVGELMAICVSNYRAEPGDRGEFLLYVDDDLVANNVSRERALEHLLTGFRV